MEICPRFQLVLEETDHRLQALFLLMSVLSRVSPLDPQFTKEHSQCPPNLGSKSPYPRVRKSQMPPITKPLKIAGELEEARPGHPIPRPMSSEV